MKNALDIRWSNRFADTNRMAAPRLRSVLDRRGHLPAAHQLDRMLEMLQPQLRQGRPTSTPAARPVEQTPPI